MSVTPDTITEKERRLLEELRRVKFGQVVIHMENGQPVRIEKVKESIKL